MITHKLIEILTIIASISTITLVIMNQPQSGDTFGSKGGIMQTRRGFEKQLHNMTVVSSVILLVLVLASQIIK
jgi:protein translocase SecG subunit